jgi:hypothetical protein
VSKLPPDDDQRDAFARHLDGMGVAELVRREPASYSRCGASARTVRAGPLCSRGWRPAISPKVETVLDIAGWVMVAFGLFAFAGLDLAAARNGG